MVETRYRDPCLPTYLSSYRICVYVCLDLLGRISWDEIGDMGFDVVDMGTDMGYPGRLCMDMYGCDGDDMGMQL